MFQNRPLSRVYKNMEMSPLIQVGWMANCAMFVYKTPYTSLWKITSGGMHEKKSEDKEP